MALSHRKILQYEVLSDIETTPGATFTNKNKLNLSMDK